MISLKETLGLSLTHTHTRTLTQIYTPSLEVNNMQQPQLFVAAFSLCVPCFFFVSFFQEQGHSNVLLQPPNTT